MPYLALITFFRLWYTSVPIFIASSKFFAPVGTIMNSWKASELPACEPPLITFIAGAGSTYGFLEPASSDRYAYSGRPFSAAPAFATTIETPSTALAPSLPLFGVPSSLRRKSSTSFCDVTGSPDLISSGPITSFTFATALVTPLPIQLLLSPSRSSTASWTPVEAPDGTAARKWPFCVQRSTSTVGLPRESKIVRPCTFSMLMMVELQF